MCLKQQIGCESFGKIKMIVHNLCTKLMKSLSFVRKSLQLLWLFEVIVKVSLQNGASFIYFEVCNAKFRHEFVGFAIFLQHSQNDILPLFTT